MKPCPDKRRSLTLHAAGVLARPESDELEQHLEICARCQEHSVALRRVASLYTMHAADAVESPDCQDFQLHFERRLLLERHSHGWRFAACMFAWPRLAWLSFLAIGAACILVWLLPRDAPEIERAQHETGSGPGAERYTASAIAGIDRSPRPIPTWMYYDDASSAEALDQLLYREWMRKVLPPPPLDLPGL